MSRATRSSTRLKNAQARSEEESITATSTPTTTVSPVFSSKTSTTSLSPPLSDSYDPGPKIQTNISDKEGVDVEEKSLFNQELEETTRRRSTRISALGKRPKLMESEGDTPPPAAKRVSRKNTRLYIELPKPQKRAESKIGATKSLKRKRGSGPSGNNTPNLAHTPQDESEEELISEDELNFDEAVELEDSSNDSSEFEDYEDNEDDDTEKSVVKLRKSTCRKKAGNSNTHIMAEDDEAEAKMLSLAIELSKEDGSHQNQAGPSNLNPSELRAAVAESKERLESDSDAEEDNESLNSDDVDPWVKGKEKESLYFDNLNPREAYRKAVKAEERRLYRKLTHAERADIALRIHHPELRTVWGDLKVRVKPIVPQKAEQPKEMKINLLPFQLESLYWMREQEKGEWKGGMLADEMGMGKTIQTLALISSDHRKPNLIVAPTVAIMQWKNEIEAYTNGLKVAIWHGASREGNIKELQKFNIVLTTYAVLESAFRKQENGFKRGGKIIKEKSPVHQIEWNRIVLDEAHNIKERATNTAKATFELQSNYKWCLSGTPLQNRVGELYSLVRFLGGDPFSFYFCKSCSCRSLHWRFTDKKTCDECHHSPMQHTCLWNHEILAPIQKYGMSGAGDVAFKKLRILLDRMMLRRTKLERADDLGLPPRTVIVRRDYFSDEEKELYLSLFSDATRQFSTYVDQGTLLNNYSNIFSLITRMRQMACHPDLVLKSRNNAGKFNTDTGEVTVCRLCNDIAEDAIQSKCHHIFDRECIKQYIDMADGRIPTCPVCHLSLTIDLDAPALEVNEEQKSATRQGILGRLDIDKWRSSTKIEALVEELTKLRNKDATTKSLVFSQFVNFLDLIAFRLQRAGFNICRLEGTMSPQARDATIKYFMNNVHVTVFLVSLKAGGVALNLTEASRVYLMDSWWNPAVEYQAMDRIHRLGQYRPVEAIKIVVEDSIESRIVQLQEKKTAMINATLSTDDSAMGRLTPEDLSFLFRL